jgi:tetratricopeptide (TPR) repeat protein
VGFELFVVKALCPVDIGTWVEVKEIFGAALACPPADRAALLDARCGGRTQVRAEVDALLAAHTRANEFLETPAVASAAWLIDASQRVEEDRRIGPFRLVAAIGSGGMGVVYHAERVEGGFDQQVAIKIIDVALHDAETLSRFRVERQILASLNHPNVVQFLDGGVTAAGQAFVVMERVEGVRVTDFCRNRQLALEARLQIVEQICGAVQYAHQHGVVHRDLKPGNILVTDAGVVKVLDFGIAKLLASGAEGDRTRTGMLRPLTPDYASPEQLRGLPITTASDIYALGVLLYEIVAGQKPYETSHETLDRVLEIVTATDPARPSQTLTRTAGAVPYDGSRVRGDLDAIILKAMHKDPSHRYASAQELATDLSRYRASEPVTAREPSLGYLIRKTARRHRAAAWAAAVSLVAVLAALGVSLWQTRRVAAERDRAQAHFNDARQLANALIFKVHDGIAPLAGATPVRKMIVAEALTYLERLSQDPSVDDALRVELASGYRRIGAVQGGLGEANLGDRAGAKVSLERAAKLLEPLATRPGAALRDVIMLASLERELSGIYQAVGERPAAIAAIKSSTTRLERLLLEHPTSPEVRTGLATTVLRLGYGSPTGEAIGHFQRSLDLFEGLLRETPDNPTYQRNVALTSKNLGARFEENRDLEKARAHYARAMELDEQQLAAQPLNRNAMFDVAIDIGNIANIDWKANRLKEAAEGFERSLALRQKLAALDPQDVDARSRVAFMHGRLANFIGPRSGSRTRFRTPARR